MLHLVVFLVTLFYIGLVVNLISMIIDWMGRSTSADKFFKDLKEFRF